MIRTSRLSMAMCTGDNTFNEQVTVSIIREISGCANHQSKALYLYLIKLTCTCFITFICCIRHQ